MNTPATAAPGPRDGAALAQLVGDALAHAQGYADTEDAAEVQAITNAMVRRLIGAPLHSDGKLTIVSLATEAGPMPPSPTSPADGAGPGAAALPPGLQRRLPLLVWAAVRSPVSSPVSCGASRCGCRARR
ncbi:hypothetical protein AABB02_05500 [Streptomyces rimosus]|uniref:hypothetical protein n=1 Tax=Streptomyces rimosus TaxID=1927 RepID=UPI0031DAB423